MRLAAIALALCALAGAAGWFATDRLQRDDAFCVSCHVSDLRGRPRQLHERLARRFQARPPASLAAAHAAAGLPGRGDDDAFHCIDCHGGSGAWGRTRIKAVAARDALVWLAGHGQEPRGMRVPLGDADCRRCHARLEPEGGVEPLARFHGRSEHSDAEAGCLGCHPSHPKADPRTGFLDVAGVRQRCAECHSGMRAR